MKWKRRHYEQTYGYNVRQSMQYNRHINLYNKVMNAYNAVPPFSYSTHKVRYKQTWGRSQQTGQSLRTVPENQPAGYRTYQPRYNLPRPPSVGNGVGFGQVPALGYEQQNKSWAQYTPFTLKNYNPFKRNDQPKLPPYYNRPTSLTRRVYRQAKWFKQSFLPKGEYNYPPEWISRKTRFWIARHIPWGLLTSEGKPTATDDISLPPVSKHLLPPRPCFHYVQTSRGTKKVPCSQTNSFQTRRKSLLKYFNYTKNARGSYYRKYKPHRSKQRTRSYRPGRFRNTRSSRRRFLY